MEVQDIVGGIVDHMRGDSALAALLPTMTHDDSAGDPTTSPNVWANDIVPSGAPYPVVMAPIGESLEDVAGKNSNGELAYTSDIFVIGEQDTEEELNAIASRIRVLFNRAASSLTIANHSVKISTARGPHEAANVANGNEIARAVEVQLTMEDA